VAHGNGISTVLIFTPRTSTAREGMSRWATFGDHVFVFADAAGQDFGNVGVGNHGEAEIDRAPRRWRTSRRPLRPAPGRTRTRDACCRAGSRAIPSVRRLEPAEGERGAAGEAEGVNDGRCIGAIGNQKVSQFMSTRRRLSCAAMVSPAVFDPMKTRMLRSCRSRASCSATSSFGSAPTQAGETRHTPSTSLMPCSRRMLSGVGPSQKSDAREMPHSGFMASTAHGPPA